MFETNSYVLVRMMRDISSAYLAEIEAGNGGKQEDDVVRSKLLLQRLEALDYRFITGFPHVTDERLASNLSL